MPLPSPIRSASLLAIGTELTVGETRDTNSSDLAAELTGRGVVVRRMSQVPDDFDVVVAGLRQGLAEADLVVTTGGLGPTPDDLTREAIAAVAGETPEVDPATEAWLRGLFERRGMSLAPTNRKQAWLIPSATGLPNPHGTAPGWWVEAPGGGVIVALPGPPREMRPMWRDHVVPRLLERGLGEDRAAETLRLAGIGESALVDVIGEEVLRRPQPQVATYARVDAVDVRVSAVGDGTRSARQVVDEAVAELLPRIDRYVFARGDEGWPEAVAKRLGGRTVAVLEVGLWGHLVGLLGAQPWLVRAEVLPAGAGRGMDLRVQARAARAVAGADVGLVVRAREAGSDLRLGVAIDLAGRATETRARIFLAGDIGRRRAANAGCSALWTRLGEPGPRDRRRRS